MNLSDSSSDDEVWADSSKNKIDLPGCQNFFPTMSPDPVPPKRKYVRRSEPLSSATSSSFVIPPPPLTKGPSQLCVFQRAKQIMLEREEKLAREGLASYTRKPPLLPKPELTSEQIGYRKRFFLSNETKEKVYREKLQKEREEDVRPFILEPSRVYSTSGSFNSNMPLSNPNSNRFNLPPNITRYGTVIKQEPRTFDVVQKSGYPGQENWDPRYAPPKAKPNPPTLALEPARGTLQRHPPHFDNTMPGLTRFAVRKIHGYVIVPINSTTVNVVAEVRRRKQDPNSESMYFPVKLFTKEDVVEEPEQKALTVSKPKDKQVSTLEATNRLTWELIEKLEKEERRKRKAPTARKQSSKDSSNAVVVSRTKSARYSARNNNSEPCSTSAISVIPKHSSIQGPIEPAPQKKRERNTRNSSCLRPVKTEPGGNKSVGILGQEAGPSFHQIIKVKQEKEEPKIKIEKEDFAMEFSPWSENSVGGVTREVKVEKVEAPNLDVKIKIEKVDESATNLRRSLRVRKPRSFPDYICL